MALSEHTVYLYKHVTNASSIHIVCFVLSSVIFCLKSLNIWMPSLLSFHIRMLWGLGAAPTLLRGQRWLLLLFNSCLLPSCGQYLTGEQQLLHFQVPLTSSTWPKQALKRIRSSGILPAVSVFPAADGDEPSQTGRWMPCWITTTESVHKFPPLLPIWNTWWVLSVNTVFCTIPRHNLKFAYNETNR